MSRLKACMMLASLMQRRCINLMNYVYPLIKKFTAQEIKSLRLKEHVSQAVFAKYLNISSSTVRQWEQGEKHPRGTSLKLLNLVADKGLSILS